MPSLLANAWISVLLVAAGVEASSTTVSKLHVSLPSHCWLQHRLDSWYTCSIREWAPVSGDWPVSKCAPFSILIIDTSEAHTVTLSKYSNYHVTINPNITPPCSFVSIDTGAVTYAEQQPNWSLFTLALTQQNVDGNLLFWPNTAPLLILA